MGLLEQLINEYGEFCRRGGFLEHPAATFREFLEFKRLGTADE